MASELDREKLKRDVVCSLCSDYFVRPVTLSCSHSFCIPCIMKFWKKMKENFPCPSCGQLFPKKSVYVNWELTKIVESAKHLNVYEKHSASVCKEHGKEVTYFCENDEKLLCPDCEQSPHQFHNILSTEAAAGEQKEFLRNCLKSLEKNLQDHLEVKSNVEIKMSQLLKRKEAWSLRITDEFEHLQKFLEEKKQTLLTKLDEEMESEIKAKENYISSLENAVTDLCNLIKEIKVKLQQQAATLLKDNKKSLQKRYGISNVPSMFNIDYNKGVFCGPLQYFCWKKMMKEIGPAPSSSLTLDPATASPQLLISATRKCAFFTETRRDVPDNANRFDDHPCVLGSEGFQAGRHYWEVEFNCYCCWTVGVTKESAIRKGPVQFTSEEGYWVVPFFAPYKPWRIGVFLDYDEGQVSFYDLEKMSHFKTVSVCFTEKVFPFFYMRQSMAPCNLHINPGICIGF